MDYKTADYTVVLINHPDEEGEQIYGIRNIETGVIEYDDMILPRTLEALTNLQEKLDDARNALDSPQLTLIEGGVAVGEEEDSLH